MMEVTDHVIEILNSLFAAFIFTELAISSTARLSKLNLILSWMLLNICVRHIKFVQDVVNYDVKFIFDLFSFFIKFVGTSIYICIYFIIFIGIYLYWILVTKKLGYKFDYLRTLIILIVLTILHILKVDLYIFHIISWKRFLLVFLFTSSLYLDTRRYSPSSSSLLFSQASLSSFFSALVQGISYSIPAIPFIAIAISCLFLFLIIIFEQLGFDPENSKIFNDITFYSILYGPFYVIYWYTKKIIVSQNILPI